VYDAVSSSVPSSKHGQRPSSSPSPPSAVFFLRLNFGAQLARRVLSTSNITPQHIPAGPYPSTDRRLEPNLDRRRWFGRDPCNGRGIRPDRGSPRPAVLAPRPARSSTAQHDLTPPLRRYGRSGARGPSIYLGGEPDAATSIPDGAADVKFNIPFVALACY
ncbi:hypothetical protein THAOC_02007, partial [Thalassiosira oceanica]